MASKKVSQKADTKTKPGPSLMMCNLYPDAQISHYGVNVNALTDITCDLFRKLNLSKPSVSDSRIDNSAYARSHNDIDLEYDIAADVYYKGKLLARVQNCAFAEHKNPFNENEDEDEDEDEDEPESKEEAKDKKEKK
jgi:hypothetical protein